MHSLELPPAALVTQAISHLPWLDGAKWLALSGGRSNFAWQVTPGAPHQTVVVKLYRGPAKNPLFPNEPGAEAQLLRALQATGIAPTLLSAFTSELGACNIYSHIPGSSWTEDAAQVGKCMRRLHGMALPTGLRSVPNGSTELSAQTAAILSGCRTASNLMSLRPPGAVGPSNTRVLLHGDIVPGNLISNEMGLHLIDWQCPAAGDPCEDIAIFLSPAMQQVYRGRPLDPASVQAFFDAYNRADIKGRYHDLAPWYHWRMAAYCAWQAENGRPDYALGRDLEIAALQRSFSP